MEHRSRALKLWPGAPSDLQTALVYFIYYSLTYLSSNTY